MTHEINFDQPPGPPDPQRLEFFEKVKNFLTKESPPGWRFILLGMQPVPMTAEEVELSKGQGEAYRVFGINNMPLPMRVYAVREYLNRLWEEYRGS